MNAVVTQADPNAPWNKPDKDSSGPTAIWTVTPDAANQYLFDQLGILRLRFDTLRTQAKVDAGSPLFIQCAGLPRYNDCLLQVPPLNKTAPVPSVRDFHATAAGQPIEPNSTIDFAMPVQLVWDVFAAEDCLLQDGPDPYDRLPVACVEHGRTIEARPTQAYTLLPRIGDQLYSDRQRQVVFSIAPPIADTITSTQEPGEPNTHVTLAWTCRNGDHCVLYANDVQIADGLPLVGSQMIPTAAATTYKIECIGVGAPSSQHTVVSVPPRPHADFSLEYGSPTSNHPFWHITLRWSTQNAARCEVTDIGIVPGARGNAPGPSFLSSDLTGQWNSTGDWNTPYPDFGRFFITARGNGTVQTGPIIFVTFGPQG